MPGMALGSKQGCSAYGFEDVTQSRSDTKVGGTIGGEVRCSDRVPVIARRSGSIVRRYFCRTRRRRPRGRNGQSRPADVRRLVFISQRSTGEYRASPGRRQREVHAGDVGGAGYRWSLGSRIRSLRRSFDNTALSPLRAVAFIASSELRVNTPQWRALLSADSITMNSGFRLPASLPAV